jgi:hypothetical protein
MVIAEGLQLACNFPQPKDQETDLSSIPIELLI